MCHYESQYSDFEKELERAYKCEEESVEDGLCIFHNPDYWKQNPAKVTEEFHKKLQTAIKNNEQLLCIGYNLPDIEYHDIISSPIYFNDSKLHVRVDFRRATFTEADFISTTFTEAVDFGGASFSKEVDFSLATFSGTEHFRRISRSRLQEESQYNTLLI